MSVRYLSRQEMAADLNIPEDSLLTIMQVADEKCVLTGPECLYHPDMTRMEVARYMRISRSLEEVVHDYDLSTKAGLDKLLGDLPMITRIHFQDSETPLTDAFGLVLISNLSSGKEMWLPFGVIAAKERSARNVYSRKLGTTITIPDRTDLYLERNLEKIKEMFSWDKTLEDSDGPESPAG